VETQFTLGSKSFLFLEREAALVHFVHKERMKTHDSFKWEHFYFSASETLLPVHSLNITQTFQKIRVDITISQSMHSG